MCKYCNNLWSGELSTPFVDENNMLPFDTSNLLDQLAEDDKKKNHLGRTEEYFL